MNISSQAIQRLLEKRTRGDLDWCQSYGEPGYDAPEHGIIFANWNHVSQPVQDWLEHHGYALEWSDEWITDSSAQKAYRTSPDSYGWKPSCILTEDGEIIGADEVRSGDEIDTYIEYLLNDANRADTFDIDWTRHGFELVNNDYESGFHPGQTDNPRKILRVAQERCPNHDFLFQIGAVGQFDMRFALWSRPQE